jgi:hypothetical protein
MPAAVAAAGAAGAEVGGGEDVAAVLDVEVAAFEELLRVFTHGHPAQEKAREPFEFAGLDCNARGTCLMPP